jgi:hypothetical protein
MSAVEAVVERLRELPPDKQQAVLEFVMGLQAAPVSGADARKTMDQIRQNLQRRHGTLDVVVPLLREDRER